MPGALGAVHLTLKRRPAVSTVSTSTVQSTRRVSQAPSGMPSEGPGGGPIFELGPSGRGTKELQPVPRHGLGSESQEEAWTEATATPDGGPGSRASRRLPAPPAGPY